MKLHATKTILLTIYLIGAQVYAHQLDIDGSESAVTNDDKSSLELKQHYQDHEAHGESDKGPAETYERVVLEGSSIRISCPHLITNTLNTSFSTIQKKGNTSGKHEPPASLGQQSKLDTNLEQVKWFRNHVPLLNLNHSPPSKEFQAQNLVSQTTINITELHRTAESNQSVSKTWPQVAQLQAATTVQKNLLQLPKVSLAQLPDSLHAENANEPPLDIRQRANVLKPSHEQLPDSADWQINTFGELVIRKVSKYFAGKYTCLAGGKHSEVLLDVLLDSRVHSGSNEQAVMIQGTALGEPRVFENPTAPEPNTSSMLSKINDNSTLIEETVFQKAQMRSRKADSEVEPRKNELDDLLEDEGLRGFKVKKEGVSSTPESNATNSSSVRRRAFAKKRLSRWRSSNWRARPLHIMRPEVLQIDDLKLIPGLLYTKQQMHCPISSALGLHSAHVYALVKELCKGPAIGKRDEVECKQLATHVLSRILSEADTKLDLGCTSISELLWFKNEVKLKFDADGKSMNTKLGMKLIDSLSRFDGKNLDQKLDFSGEERHSSAGYVSNQSSDCPQPIQGRTLEIDGLGKDSDGRYSCALKLSIAKLLEVIQSIKGFTDSTNRRNNNEISRCDGSHFHVEPDFKHEQSSFDSEAQIEQPIAIRSVNSTAGELPGLQEKLNATKADNHLLTDRIALFKSFLERKGLAREQSLDCIEKLLSRLPDPLTTVQTFSLVVSERSGNSGDVYIFQPRSTSPSTPSSLLSLMPPPPLSSPVEPVMATKTYSQTRTPLPARESSSSSSNGSGSSNSVEPIKRLNANIDDATELNRLSFNDDEASSRRRRRIKRHRLEISGGRPRATTLVDDSSATITLDRDLDQATDLASNEVHLMHDNNDNRTSTFVGVNHPGNYLHPYNADDSESLNIGVGIGQTKSHDPYEKPFNYANEVNYGPHYADRIAGDVKTKTLPLLSTTSSSLSQSSPTPTHSWSYPTERLIGRAGDYSSSGTKELITRRRRSHRINIGKSSRWRALQTSRYHRQARRPMVIDKQQQDDKTPQSLNDEGSLAAEKPLVWQTYSYDRNLANGAADERFISQLGPHAWPESRMTRLSKRHLTAEKDDQQLEMFRSRSMLDQNSQPLIDVHDMVGFRRRSGEVETDELHVKDGSGPSSTTSQSTTFSAAQAINEQKQGPMFSDQQKTDGPTQTTMTLAQLNKNTFQALDSDDTSDESLMWSASHYLHMHMKALATSSMFGVEVGVEWSNERANQTNVPSDVELKSELYRDDAFARTQSPSASPFATIDMLSGQDLQLECTAHTLGRLPEVKWYKRVTKIPIWLKSVSAIARKIGNDLYWPLTEIELLDDKPFGHVSFVASQTMTVFDNLENQTFTVVNNLQLSQYNDRTQSRSSNLPLSDYNLYACIVDADVRHNYATLGVHFREALGKFAFEVTKRLRARTVTSESNEAHQWPTDISPSGSNVYDLFRTNEIQFPLGSHWIPIQNRSELEDLNYDALPYAPMMLTATIVVVSVSLLTLVYLTIRSYRGLVDLQMEENLTSHKMVENDDYREDELQVIGEDFKPNYCSLQKENQTECSCHYDTELISGNPLNFETQVCEEGVILELESNPPIHQTFAGQFYATSYPEDNRIIYESFATHPIISSPSNQNLDCSHSPSDSSFEEVTSSGCCSQDVYLQSSSSERQNINVFENPISSDKNFFADYIEKDLNVI